MQRASESHQPHASAEQRLAEQARETQQLREQLARAPVKEGPTLPPLSVPELNKETSGCPTLWGCSMVCIGKNIANCSKNPQFFPVMCALCTHAPLSTYSEEGSHQGEILCRLLFSDARPGSCLGKEIATLHVPGGGETFLVDGSGTVVPLLPSAASAPVASMPLPAPAAFAVSQSCALCTGRVDGAN